VFFLSEESAFFTLAEEKNVPAFFVSLAPTPTENCKQLCCMDGWELITANPLRTPEAMLLSNQPNVLFL